jgi:ankyrin repeat protein
MQRAAYGGDVEFMKLLNEYKANPFLANVNGVSPLTALTMDGASRNRDKSEQKVIESLRLLFTAGIDVNTRGAGGTTPLHTAVRQNWLDTVRFLAERGADLDARDNRGLTPLDYATGGADSQQFGNFDVVGELPEMAQLLMELGSTERRQAD